MVLRPMTFLLYVKVELYFYIFVFLWHYVIQINVHMKLGFFFLFCTVLYCITVNDLINAKLPINTPYLIETPL